MKITDEMVEKAWQFLNQRVMPKDVRFALAAVAPLIRSAALEEAARVADEFAKESWGHTELVHAGETLGASIRALKDKEPTP